MSKPKRKGGPLRIPSPGEVTPKLTIIDIVEMSLPLINIVIAIIFILIIPEIILDLILFVMLVLTIAFFISFFIELWVRYQTTHTEGSLLIYNSVDVSPYVLYAGQFFYGYFFLSFIFLGYIEAVSGLSIFLWVYFCFSTLFLIFIFWAIIAYVKEAGIKKEELEKEIMEDLHKYEKTENYAAQSYYIQLLIKLTETPIIKAGFLSKLITFITFALTIVPFILPV
ncbi:MAG: hypothetical protein ACFFEY_20935 [Candidatus Thorarchaeota archaeon]